MPNSALSPVRCKRCDATIAWVRTTSGNRMPVDFTPNQAGNVFVTFNAGQLLATVCAPSEKAKPDGVRYMPHFATCAASKTPAKTTAPPPAPQHEQMGLL